MSVDDDLIEQGQPLLTVDGSFRVLRVNRAWEDLHRQTRQEVVGRSFWDVCPGDARWRAELERCMAQRVPAVLTQGLGDSGLSVRIHPREGGGLALFFRDATDVFGQ